jgi:hypothetical protein
MRSIPFLLTVLQLLAVATAIWPEPQQMTNGSSVLFISPDVKFSYKAMSGTRSIRYVLPASGGRSELTGAQ